MFNYYESKIYNGVNHDVLIYNDKDIVIDRKGQYFLKDENATLQKRIGRSREPLSVQSNYIPIVDNQYKIYLPEGYNSKIDPLTDYYNYDIIIVSSKYANLATQTNGAGNFDFLDRMFIPIQLYSYEDYINNKKLTKVGSAGLKKVCFPKWPQQYMIDLQNGFNPSKTAMQTCLYWYKIGGFKPDYNTACGLQAIESYLSSLY